MGSGKVLDLGFSGISALGNSHGALLGSPLTSGLYDSLE